MTGQRSSKPRANLIDLSPNKYVMEYAVASWSPWTGEDKETLERVQSRAVGMVSNLRGGLMRLGWG